MLSYTYVGPYVKIKWTKRFVRHRATSLRLTLRRLKYENRVKKRDNCFMMVENIKIARNPFWSNKPQRRNFNSVYRPIQIPV